MIGVRVTPTGTAGIPFPVADAAGDQLFAHAAFGGGMYLVVWQDGMAGPVVRGAFVAGP